MLKIKDLTAIVGHTPILKGVNLDINRGDIHAIMGPNGAGKSTLAKILAGHPAYEVTGGEVWFKGQNLLELEPENRARLGLFMSFQYPVEIPGVSNAQFLHTALNAKRKGNGQSELTDAEFAQLLEKKRKVMEIRPEFTARNVNENFSGGEKKRNEILQMAILHPDLAVLDETDSGLDIDALQVVARGVNSLRSQHRAFLLITHYQRLLDYIAPDFVHVLSDGTIVKSGNKELAIELEKQGYRWINETSTT